MLNLRRKAFQPKKPKLRHPQLAATPNFRAESDATSARFLLPPSIQFKSFLSTHIMLLLRNYKYCLSLFSSPITSSHSKPIEFSVS
jgi:hypothetical protein